jgi:hypothetical protein
MDSYTPSLADLEARLAKLERQNRRWKYLGFPFRLLGRSMFLLAKVLRKRVSPASTAAKPTAAYDTLVVRRLELRDKAGKLRGFWAEDADGSGLVSADAGGKNRAALAVTLDSPGLALLDTAGKPRIALALDASDAGLSLPDAAGNLRAVLAVAADIPGLTLRDSAGQQRAQLAVPRGIPMLTFRDSAGKQGAMLTERGLLPR